MFERVGAYTNYFAALPRIGAFKQRKRFEIRASKTKQRERFNEMEDHKNPTLLIARVLFKGKCINIHAKIEFSNFNLLIPKIQYDEISIKYEKDLFNKNLGLASFVTKVQTTTHSLLKCHRNKFSG